MIKRKLLAFTLAIFLGVPAAYAQSQKTYHEPLQGKVEDQDTSVSPGEAKTNKDIMDLMDPVSPPVPKKDLNAEENDDDDLEPGTGKFDFKKGPLEGKIRADDLNGNADDSTLNAGTGKLDPTKGPLKGTANMDDMGGLQGQDPDLDDRELQVEWDKWRNRFLWAVQSGVQEALNNPDDTMMRWDPQRQSVVMRFPMGTVAWFACKITNDKRIENLKLMHTSNYPGYDKAVLQAVKSLEGTTILRFPKRSKRLFVSQSAGIKTAETGERQFFNFGDVERYRTGAPGNQ